MPEDRDTTWFYVCFSCLIVTNSIILNHHHLKIKWIGNSCFMNPVVAFKCHAVGAKGAKKRWENLIIRFLMVHHNSFLFTSAAPHIATAKSYKVLWCVSSSCKNQFLKFDPLYSLCGRTDLHLRFASDQCAWHFTVFDVLPQPQLLDEELALK